MCQFCFNRTLGDFPGLRLTDQARFQRLEYDQHFQNYLGNVNANFQIHNQLA